MMEHASILRDRSTAIALKVSLALGAKLTSMNVTQIPAKMKEHAWMKEEVFVVSACQVNFVIYLAYCKFFYAFLKVISAFKSLIYR